MNRLLLITAVTAALFTSQTFALTMSLQSDNRSIGADALTSQGTDSDSDVPGIAFSNFNSTVNARYPELLPPPRITEQLNGQYDPSAYAEANQGSTIDAYSISGSGYAYANGSGGLPVPSITRLLTTGDAQGESLAFESEASSILEVIFSIDEAAEFSLQGFISAGMHIVMLDALSNESMNQTSVLLYNNTTGTTEFETTINEGSSSLDESGIIGPGTYTFNVQSYAKVYGENVGIPIQLTGDAQDEIPIGRDYSNAGFEQVSLSLSSTEQPIPEPLTTTLACLGLGALVFKTSRRHHV